MMKTLPVIKVALLCALALTTVSCTSARFFVAPESSSKVARNAMSWKGRHFRPGRSHQCANWVTHVVAESGKEPPSGSSLSRSWVDWGKTVPKSQIKPGDVLVFANTYRGGISHVGIALENGEFIHRSTYNSPVKISSLERYQIASVRRG